MSKIISTCPKCNKNNVKQINRFTVKETVFIRLSCGHVYSEKLTIAKIDDNEIKLRDGKKLYNYQIEGFKFAEQSNFNCLIADEQGLGKTIQAVAIIDRHFNDLKPILIVVKKSLTIQWQKYLISCTDKFAQILTTKDEPIPNLNIYITTYDTAGKLETTFKNLGIKTVILDECQMIKNHEAKRTQGIRAIVNTKVLKKKDQTPIDPAPKITMIAKDLMIYHGINERFKFKIDDLGRALGLTRCKVVGQGIIMGEIILDKKHVQNDPIEEIIETILHEIAHAITPGAGHKPIWVECAKSIGSTGDVYAFNWCEGTQEISNTADYEKMVKHKIFLSGTPIKNNAIEYWPSLNLLQPQMFPNRSDWLRHDVGYWLNSKGVWKPGGLKYPEEFKRKTAHFIIRRERKEVFPELPDVTRDFRYFEISSDEMQAYSLGIKKLENFLKSNENGNKNFNFTSELNGHIMILRHITGLAKILPTMEFIDEFRENEPEDWKLPLFHTHIDIGDIVCKHLDERGIGYERIVSANDALTRTNKLDRLRNDPDCHMIVLPSLASAEGFDLDFCSTGVLLEREWNPANEEQIEGRFIRATESMLAKARLGNLKATIIYPIAVNTIDEFFAELVERKRQYVHETLSGKSSGISWNESEVMLDLAKIAIQKMKDLEGRK